MKRGTEKKPDKLFEKLEGYCNPRKNEVLESHRFWNVQYQEPFDNFLTELRTRASSCNFDNKDRMIRDKIVFTVQGKLQELRNFYSVKINFLLIKLFKYAVHMNSQTKQQYLTCNQ